MHGLGLMQTTATGVKFTSGKPTCITAVEHAEAVQKCQEYELRGIGDTRNLGTMSGRLAAFAPCDLYKLPICPIPTCIDEATATIVAQCMSGASAIGEFDCRYAPLFAQFPLCGPLSKLPAVPTCLSVDQAASRAYCISSNAQGPNKAMNGLCWLAMKDKAYWARMIAAPICYTSAYVPPPPPPVVVAPPAEPPRVQEPPATPPAVDTAPQTSEAGTVGMFGILALVAVAGGGYYLYRRYKR